jgi:hypothetical protein
VEETLPKRKHGATFPCQMHSRETTLGSARKKGSLASSLCKMRDADSAPCTDQRTHQEDSPVQTAALVHSGKASREGELACDFYCRASPLCISPCLGPHASTQAIEAKAASSLPFTAPRLSSLQLSRNASCTVDRELRRALILRRKLHRRLAQCRMVN